MSKFWEKKKPSLKLLSVQMTELQFRNTQFIDSFRGKKPQTYQHTQGCLKSRRPWLVQEKQKLHFRNRDKHRSSQKILHWEPDAAGPLRTDFSDVFLQWRGCSCHYNGSSWRPCWHSESSALRLPVCYLGWFSTLVTPITRPLQHQTTCLTLGRGAVLFPDLLEWQSRNIVMKYVSC